MMDYLRVLAVAPFAFAFTVAVPLASFTTPLPQAPTVIVEGTVFHPNRTPLPGVAVTIERSGQAVAWSVTDARGQFRFDKLVPGQYRLKAVLRGFKTMLAPLALQPGAASVTVPITMVVGEMAETEVVNVGVAGGVVGDVKVAPPARPMTVSGQRGIGGLLRARITAEVPPRMQPPSSFNTEGYAHIASNPFRLTSAAPLSTFAADVDTASYTNVRRFLREGQLPPVDAVRVEELINYFRFPYPEPDDGHPVSITTEVGEAPWAPGHKLVLVGLRARPIDDRGVGGRNIVLLIDVSGSMSSADKLPLLKTGLRMFVDSLRDEDRIALVVYAGASGVVLPSTPARSRHRIHDAIERLHSGGSTNGAEGLALAYRVARQEFIDGGINRVVLATDGDFNVGVTSDGDLVRMIEKGRESGVFLSVLGVGTGNLKDSKMEALADKGNGNYAYLDSLHEARRVLVQEGGATLETVAKDVKFQVEFNPATVAAWKLIGYENRLLADEDFNDDTKDGGELGAGHTVTALYEIVPAGAPLPDELSRADGVDVVDPLIYQTDRRPVADGNGDLLTVKVRYKLPDASISALMTEAVGAEAAIHALPFAAAVAEFGMLLRDRDAAIERWDALTERLEAMPATVNDAADHQRFRELVELAAGLARLGDGALFHN